MENDKQKTPNNKEEYTSSQDPSAQNTEDHEEEGGRDYSGNIQGGQGGKSSDGDENSTHDQGSEESNAGRLDS